MDTMDRMAVPAEGAGAGRSVQDLGGAVAIPASGSPPQTSERVALGSVAQGDGCQADRGDDGQRQGVLDRGGAEDAP